MKPRALILALAAVAVAVVALLKRPIKQPQEAGSWEPAAPKSSHR